MQSSLESLISCKDILISFLNSKSSADFVYNSSILSNDYVINYIEEYIRNTPLFDFLIHEIANLAIYHRRNKHFHVKICSILIHFANDFKTSRFTELEHYKTSLASYSSTITNIKEQISTIIKDIQINSVHSLYSYKQFSQVIATEQSYFEFIKDLQEFTNPNSIYTHTYQSNKMIDDATSTIKFINKLINKYDFYLMPKTLTDALNMHAISQKISLLQFYFNNFNKYYKTYMFTKLLSANSDTIDCCSLFESLTDIAIILRFLEYIIPKYTAIITNYLSEHVANNDTLFYMFNKNFDMLKLLIDNNIIILNLKHFEIMNSEITLRPKMWMFYKKFLDIYAQNSTVKEAKILLHAINMMLISKFNLENRDANNTEYTEEIKSKLENYSENNNYHILSLIEDDNLDDFITYITVNKVSLNQRCFLTNNYDINEMLFETWFTYFDYTVFYGAVKIMKYLYLQNISYSNSVNLSKYLVHSGSSEIVYFIEDKFSKDVIDYKVALETALLCNEYVVADYIINCYSEKINDLEDVIKHDLILNSEVLLN